MINLEFLNYYIVYKPVIYELSVVHKIIKKM